jgi:hypothetical protein
VAWYHYNSEENRTIDGASGDVVIEVRYWIIVLVFSAGLVSSTDAAAQTRALDRSEVWGPMFRKQVERCWKKPFLRSKGETAGEKIEAAFAIRLKRDGTLDGAPRPEKASRATPYLQVYQDSALQALVKCQPYDLPAADFEQWKYFAPVFTEPEAAAVS